MSNSPGFQLKIIRCPPAGCSPSSPMLVLAHIVSCWSAVKFFFRELPFYLPAEDRDFLLAQPWSELRLHKNVSYRPGKDALRGRFGRCRDDGAHSCHSELRRPGNWLCDEISFALCWKMGSGFFQFRPLEEQGRDLPLHKRNDLLHVDAFPRVRRVAWLHPANLHEPQSNLSAHLEYIRQTGLTARQYADAAGLRKFANESALSRTVQTSGRTLGFRGMGRTPHDAFMLRFHDYLKENSAFQENLAQRSDSEFWHRSPLRFCFYRRCAACGPFRPGMQWNRHF